MTRRPPITPDRLDSIVSRLDDLDWQVLEDLDRLRMVSSTQLQRLRHGAGEAAKKRSIRQLKRLSGLGVVLRMDRRVGGAEGGSFPRIYTLGLAGMRLMHPERSRQRQPWTPSNPYIAHHLAVSEVFVKLAGATGIEVVSFTTEPGCWRRFRMPTGVDVSLKPDAHVVVDDGTDEHHWFIEVDRATESLPRLAVKCRSYADYWRSGIEEDEAGVFPRVLWCVPDSRRLAQVVDAISRLDAEDWPLFVVVTDADVAEVIAGRTEGVTP